MERKDFLKKGLVSGALLGGPVFASAHTSIEKSNKQDDTGSMRVGLNSGGDPEEIIIERPMPGKPHKGKVLLAIQAHSDDIPLFAGGTVAK